MTAVAGALRGAGPSVTVLFAATFAMGLGIALVQPAFPPLAALWFPARVGFATAIYTNGLLGGELLAAALTAPLLVTLVGGSWEWTLAAWSLPVAAGALLVAATTPHVERDEAEPSARWWPDWSDRHLWLLGLIFGSGSALYWASNTFVPDYLHATHRPELVAAGLTAINLAQFGASAVVAIFPRQVLGHRWPFIATGALIVVSAAGFLAMPGAWAVAWAAVFGFTSASTLVLTLALAPMLAPDDSHRLTAGIFTLSYTLAFTAPWLSGAAWDASGLPAAAFLPAFLEGGLIILLSLFLRLPKHGSS